MSISDFIKYQGRTRKQLTIRQLVYIFEYHFKCDWIQFSKRQSDWVKNKHFSSVHCICENTHTLKVKGWKKGSLYKWKWKTADKAIFKLNTLTQKLIKDKESVSSL